MTYNTLLSIAPMFALILVLLSQFREAPALLRNMDEYLSLVAPEQADALVALDDRVVTIMGRAWTSSTRRARFTLAELEDIAGGIQVTWHALIEIEGQHKPACVAEMIARRYA